MVGALRDPYRRTIARNVERLLDRGEVEKRVWIHSGDPLQQERIDLSRIEILTLYEDAYSGPAYEKLPMRILRRRTLAPQGP